MNDTPIPPQSHPPPDLTEEQLAIYQDLLAKMAAVVAADQKDQPKPSLPPLSCPPSLN